MNTADLSRVESVGPRMPSAFAASTLRYILAELDAAHLVDDIERLDAALARGEELAKEIERWGEGEERAANDR